MKKKKSRLWVGVASIITYSLAYVGGPGLERTVWWIRILETLVPPNWMTYGCWGGKAVMARGEIRAKGWGSYFSFIRVSAG